MTEPISIINGLKTVGEKSKRDDMFKRDKHGLHQHEPENDSVDISDEARDKSSGKKRKNILEYLDEEGIQTS